MSVDSGLVVVGFITLVYIILGKGILIVALLMQVFYLRGVNEGF